MKKEELSDECVENNSLVQLGAVVHVPGIGVSLVVFLVKQPDAQTLEPRADELDHFALHS